MIVGEARLPQTKENFYSFVTNSEQGINYCPGTWHHSLLVIQEGNYLVVDHAGPSPELDQDYEEV